MSMAPSRALSCTTTAKAQVPAPEGCSSRVPGGTSVGGRVSTDAGEPLNERRRRTRLSRGSSGSPRGVAVAGGRRGGPGGGIGAGTAGCCHHSRNSETSSNALSQSSWSNPRSTPETKAKSSSRRDSEALASGLAFGEGLAAGRARSRSVSLVAGLRSCLNAGRHHDTCKRYHRSREKVPLHHNRPCCSHSR